MALREPEKFVAKPQREGGGKQLYIHIVHVHIGGLQLSRNIHRAVYTPMNEFLRST